LPWFDPSGQVAVPGNTGRQRLGQSGRESPTGDPESPTPNKEAIQKAQKVIEWFGYGQTGLDVVVDPVGALANQIGLGIPNWMFGKILDFNFSTWTEVCKELGDPPRADYDAYAMPEEIAFVPLEAGPQLPAARASALNGLMQAALSLSARLRAAQISYDRFGGAVAAGDNIWTWRQALAYVYYKRQAGEAMSAVAGCLDSLLQALRAEGIAEISVSREAYEEYQHRLRTGGFSAQEIEAARAGGLSDEEIGRARATRIAVSVDEIGGSLMEAGGALALALRTVGERWTSLPLVPPPWESESGP